MKTLKLLANFSLSLILLLLLVATQISFTATATLLDADYYTKKLNAGGYYQELKQVIETGFASLGPATGLPKQVFADSVDINWLQSEGNAYIKSIIDYINGKQDSIKYELDAKPVKDKLQSNINTYAKSIGVVIGKDARDSIDRVIDQGINIARNYLAVVNTKENALTQVRSIGSVITGYRIPLAILCAVVAGLMFLLNYRAKLRFLQWFSYSLLASGLFISIPAGYVLLSSVLNRLAIGNAYLKAAASGLLGGFFTNIMILGAINFVLGGVLLFAAARYDIDG